MKREIFQRFVQERIELGDTAEELIHAIEKLVEQDGYLALYYEGNEKVHLTKAWLTNFQYQNYIQQQVSEQRKESGRK